jgi:hydroxymethylbilane synthase
MGRFYDYDYEDVRPFAAPIVFVSNFKAVHGEQWKDIFHSKKVWASGSRTWFELAKKGIWVEGSADGLGMESLLTPWSMPLLQYRKSDIHILTHHEARANWQNKGWKASSTYSVIPKKCPVIEKRVADSDFLFWTSYGQFSLYKNVVSDNAIHACLQGETAVLLKKQGITPVLFPTIKSFAKWKQDIAR